MVGIVLTHLGLGLAAIGALGTLRPIGRLGLRSRRRGAALALGGLALTGGALVAPAADLDAPQSAEATELDRLLPIYQFHERHAIDVDAPAGRVHAAIKAVRADEIHLFRTLVWLRRFGRPGPESIVNPAADRPLLDVAASTTFALLADTPREVLVGTVVAAPHGYVREGAPRADELLALRGQPGFAIAALTFIVTPLDERRSRVTTVTRVFASDPATRRRFAAYWRIIYPGSALIRRMWLRAVRARAENDLSLNR